MLLDKNILCISNTYNKKFFLNEPYQNLPSQVMNELKVMCVLFTEDVGGILSLVFDEEGSLSPVSFCEEGDILFDEIASGVKTGKLRKENRELFEQLENYYRVFILNEEWEG